MATGRHRKVSPRAKLLLAVAAVLAALLGGALGGRMLAPDSAAEFTAPQPATAPRDVFPGMSQSFTGHGKFRVPEQAPPGEYSITSTSGAFGCSWWVLKADDDKPKSEITAGTFNRAGYDTVVIPVNARVFKLLGDCTIRPEGGTP